MTITDGRMKRGDHTRRAVLAHAVDVASTHGLEGLSIGRLAADLSISKSGLFAHFGAKEELQLATIRAARRIYADTVLSPAMEIPPGLGRIWALSESWLAYSRGRVFPGGCFFSKAAHEFAARPGVVRDALIAANSEWLEILRRAVDDARSLGDLGQGIDVDRLAFELNALLDSANLRSILGDDRSYTRAATSVRALLDEAASERVPRPWET